MTYKPVHLECGHTRWFESALPSIDEIIYCRDCRQYVEVKGARLSGWVIDVEGHFRSRRMGTSDRYRGECLEISCTYSTYVKRGGWTALQGRMNKHYMRTHTRFGAALKIIIEDRNINEPPF